MPSNSTGPFADVAGPLFKADPAPAHGRDPRHDNEPPLEERVLQDFLDDLHVPGESGQKSIHQRLNELTDAAGRIPDSCTDEATAGKLGDFIRQTRELETRIDGAREKHNRPLLTAQRSLKARADGLTAPLLTASSQCRVRLNAFMAAEARRVEDERRAAAEQAERLRREQEAALVEEGRSAEPLVDITPRKIEAPVARGDLGARVGTATVWKHDIESVRQLPDRLLKHPKVVEALNGVIRAEIRGGERKIKGVRIWEEQEARVR